MEWINAEDRLPKGYHKIDAVTNGYEIVIFGEPLDFIEDDPLCHNCDAMGCGTFDHVLDRICVSRPLALGIMPLPDPPDVDERMADEMD